MHGFDQSKGYEGRSNQLMSVRKVAGRIVAANEFKTVAHTQCTWVQYVKENQFSTKEGEDKDPVCTADFQGKACGKEPGQECYCKVKMECFIPPGQGTDLKFSVVIGDQESNSWMFSYAPPHVHSISTGHANDPVSTFPGKDSSGGKKRVEITGSNFGLPAAMFKQIVSDFALAGHGWEKDSAAEAPTIRASRLTGGTLDGQTDRRCDLTKSDCDRAEGLNCSPTICASEEIREAGNQNSDDYKLDKMGKDDIKVTIGVHDCNIVKHEPEQLYCTDVTEPATPLCNCKGLELKDPKLAYPATSPMTCTPNSNLQNYDDKLVTGFFPCSSSLNKEARPTWIDGEHAQKDHNGKRRCVYIPGKITCSIPEGQGTRALAVKIEKQDHMGTAFFYKKPRVKRVYLESQNRTGRTDGYLNRDENEKEIMIIEGQNLGKDGFLNNIGAPRLYMLPRRQLPYATVGSQEMNFTNLTKFSVDVDRESMTVLSHDHNLLKIELPMILAGDTPTKDLQLYVVHTDEDPALMELDVREHPKTRAAKRRMRRRARMLGHLDVDYGQVAYKGRTDYYSKHYSNTTRTKFMNTWTNEKKREWLWWGHSMHGAHGIGSSKSISYVIPAPSSGNFSYQQPIFYSITNKHAGDRMPWKREDGGSTDGWYAILHGANFGYGCGGECIQTDASVAAAISSGEEPQDILTHSKSTMGTIRHEVLEYDGADQKVFRLNEIDWQRTQKDSKFDCSCKQKKGPKGKPACGAFEVTMCDHITFWNHTHIEFFVQQGVGAGLALQIDTGGQKSCSFRPKNGLDTPAKLRWCKEDAAGDVNGCQDRKYNTLNFAPEQEIVCNPNNVNEYDPSKCFCTGMDVNDRAPSMYGGWWTVVPGMDKMTARPRPSRQGRYFDTWTNPFLWQWMPRADDWPHSHVGDMIPVDIGDKDPIPWRKSWWPKRQVTINYALPVIDKITPDTLRGHDELSEVKLAQLPKEQRDAMVNQTSGTSFEIGDRGELITITGTGFGVIRNIPFVTIDEMRCENALLETSDKYPEGHPLPALTLTCDAPITIVGPKGYDERINAMRMEVRVGDQAAIINPDLDAPTKKNLLRTLCRRGKYGQEFEKCATCPSPAKGAKAAGSECMGGMGVEAEPKPAPFWFSLPLIKDDLTWYANETRFSRRPDLRFTWTAKDGDEPENYVGDALSRAAKSELDEYTSFCNQTVKPNVTVCQVDGNGAVTPEDRQNSADGLCTMPGQYPPDAFWIGSDYKTCYHYYDGNNPGFTAWGKPSNKIGYDIKCEGKGALCCLSRWCKPSAATDGINNEPAVQGWSFVRKTRSKKRTIGDKVEETDVGCAIPMTFGDPRFYIGREDSKGNCMSATHGWYVWEEDRVSNGRLPKRIKEQELANCGPAETPFCMPPTIVMSSHENGCLPRGAVGGKDGGSLCTKAVNLRVSDGGGVQGGGKGPDAKPAANNAPAPASTGLRRFLEEVAGAAAPAASDGGSMDAAASELTGADNRCHMDRWNRPVCPYFVPCDPAVACIGDNMCGVGYVGKKCNKCDYGYFRTDGYCVGCPENGYLMLGMFLAGIVVVGICLWIINKLKINIGVISIGIDYFQIIGLFSSPKIPWPKQMVTLFDYMSASSVSIDLAAPECMGQGGGMAAHEKWFLTMFLPLAVLIVMAMYVGC